MQRLVPHHSVVPSCVHQSLSLRGSRNTVLECKRVGNRGQHEFDRSPNIHHRTLYSRNNQISVLQLHRKWTLPRGCRAQYVQQRTQYSRPRTFTTKGDSSHPPLWRHEHVNDVPDGYDGLSLDIYTLDSTTLVKGDTRKTADLSDQPLGSLQLDTVSSPDDISTPAETAHHDIVMFMPRGPFPDHRHQEADDINRMLNTFHPTKEQVQASTSRELVVVKVNYRLTEINENSHSENYRYPLPIFDVNWALNYVKERYEHTLRNGGYLTVLGENFGGSLALTLALTNHEDIHAVAVIDPITDWVSLDEIASNRSMLVGSGIWNSQTHDGNSSSSIEHHVLTGRKSRIAEKEMARTIFEASQARAAKKLIRLRTQLFRTPSGFFDRFASPLLFLRAPGKDTPLWKTANPEAIDIVGNGSTAYGPYDDDWRAIGSDAEDELPWSQGPGRKKQMDTIAEAIGSDAMTMPEVEPASYKSEMSLGASSPSISNAGDSSSACSSGSLDRVLEAFPKSVKRRKVLYRWPPNGISDDALLPYTMILTTKTQPVKVDSAVAEVDYATILHPQAKEMAEVMRRACFWGRGSDLAEERVKLEEVESGKASSHAGMEAAVKWLDGKMNEPWEVQQAQLEDSDSAGPISLKGLKG